MKKFTIEIEFFYCDWIKQLTKDKEVNLDWWMTRPTLRNPYTSNLINYITVFETLNKTKIKISK